ncbi:MAG TPA: bifunctional (p)ppGpp synthetase/guanosine-3',5'-bis(diphosphate) 3'-pyrophosphohydrolase [Polyangiaceae bacterium]|nr:bifunctional (p)ppGpp synthetase/guanosine-3',5'-bis(diphosphate) 3'-pyrophosphohydrolase [Polyangiaceae bacterium]
MLSSEALVDIVQAYHPAANGELIRRAYQFAEWAHREQLRKSGDPYLIHPVSVAGIIADLRLDTASVCAGLLHDVLEDSGATRETIETEFGEEIASIVDGVTKLGKFNFTSREDRQAESFRKMVVAMAQDLRVLLVKLCDRLDNMRTLEHMKPEAQERIARETLEIYAPLAARLGMQLVKSELEDLSFRHLEPDAFRELSAKLTKTKKERDRYIESVCRTITSRLAEQGYAAEVTGRAKHMYSIHRKMKEQGCDFEQVFDTLAFRICVESVADCYAALGAMHSRWTPIPGRFKDYVALPKPNMYQSLHTTVIGPGRQRIEIQIRTHEMHRVAEHGIAAHWKYKERGSGGVDPKDAEKFGWLRELAEYQSTLKDPVEFLESVKIDLFPDEVYVFTPKGELRVLARGSTPIDFAYAIHSQVGEHCSGARANGQIVPLRYKLKNGDVMEIMTSPHQQPSKDWLEFCVTTRARARIRARLRGEERQKSINLGKELLESEMRDAGLSYSKFSKSDPEVRRVAQHFSHSHLDDLLLDIGYGKLASDKVVDTIHNASAPDSEPPSQFRAGRIEQLVRKVTGRDASGITVNGIDDVLVRYAKCCNPLPGDGIIGFITRGRGVTIHRRECQKAFDTDPERRIDVTWDNKAKINRPVQICVTTANKPGILAVVSQTFSAQSINISEANCRAGDDGRARNVFTFHCSDLSQLKNVMKALSKVNGVVEVSRI